MEVPQDAKLLAQVVLGSSSEPGEGLLVDSWAGEIPTSGEPMAAGQVVCCVAPEKWASTTISDVF